MWIVGLVLVLASVPVLAAAGYLFLLTVLSSRVPPPSEGPPRLRFDIVVPAHDEEASIASTVASLRAVDYPADMRRVLVVADNCTDATAARAEQAGATVLVRQDANLRGKGYALKFAFDRSLADGFADIVVVVDADTLVSPNLLHAFATRFERGAKAAQAEYGVRNPDASWRTRLMVIALATFHGVRSLGRERLGVSSGLRGNGMAFSREVLEAVPHEAFSLVEDLEYGMRLARAGYAVRYVEEAKVLGEMVSSEKASRSQRQRWEGGRLAMMRAFGWPLLTEAIATRDGLLLDTALDILVPPLSYLVAAAVFGTVSAILLGTVGGGYATVAIASWSTALGMIVLYVLRGVLLSSRGPRGLLDLAWAPVFMTWKLALSLANRARRHDSRWIRTARETEKT
jgi:1,2-diacylglycerol 3-beta-glucosyltransferase